MKSSKISSVDPPYGATINLGKDTLEINYEVPISLSVRNITIYQINGTNGLMRQTTSGQASEFFTIEHNKITLKVLPSTFNVPSAEYHIAIDPNFVMHKEINEPLDRLQHSSWVVITGIYYFYIIIQILRFKSSNFTYKKKIEASEDPYAGILN